MTRKQFEEIVTEEFPRAVEEKFRNKIRNVSFTVEDEPSFEVRTSENLLLNETLLGLYRGVPLTERGEAYGVGAVVPDCITLYQWPIEKEAQASDGDVRRVVRETIWHEVAHHLGLDENAVSSREVERRRSG